MFKKYIHLLLILGLVAVNQEVKAQKNKQLTIAFYNQENLFDTLNDPSKDDEEFLPSGKYQWSKQRYEAKLQNMSSIIAQLGGKAGPDILGVCEIENKLVLQDLINHPNLKSMGYAISHIESPDERGIDVGLIYKKSTAKLIAEKSLIVPLQEGNSRPTRNILLTSLLIGKDTLHTLVGHFPSRRGGQDESAPFRMAAAQTARKAIDSLQRKNSLAKIVIMGDLNDEPSNESIRDGLKARYTADSAKNGMLFNCMAPLHLKGDGSHNYKNHWSSLDQIIVSQGLVNGGKGLQLIPNSATVVKFPELFEKDERFKGRPFRTFAGNKYLNGYSDHLPVYIQLTINK